MNLFRLTLRSIIGSPYRNGLVVLCVSLVAGSITWATLVIHGAESVLRLSVADMQNMGVDLVVIPRGGGRSSIVADNVDLPGLLSKVKAVPGVENISPQQTIITLQDCPFCAGDEVFVIAFDPATDFSLENLLVHPGENDLDTGEAYAGSLISIPPGEECLNLESYDLKLTGTLQPTGTSLDQSIFISFQTARELVHGLKTPYGDIPDTSSNRVPVILVRVEAGSSPLEVAGRLLKNIPGVTVFDKAGFFQQGQTQMVGFLRAIPGLLGITWILSFLFIGLTMTIAIHERRWEIGVLRTLGSTRAYVYWLLLAEGFILALTGVVFGLGFSFLAGVIFKEGIIRSMGVPLVSIPPLVLFNMVSGSLAIAFISVSMAVLIPAWRLNRQELAVILRG